MIISYDNLWKLLIDKKMMRTELREAAGISTNALAKLGKNESVQLQILEKICAVLDCDLSDVVEIIPDNKVSSDNNLKHSIVSPSIEL